MVRRDDTKGSGGRVRRAGLLLLWLAAACGGEANGKGDGKGKQAEPLAVAVTAIAPTQIDRYYRTSGTLRALRSADLVALQPGLVLELKAEEGDQVKAGQMLVRLDGRGFKLQAQRDAITAKNASQELRRLEQISDLLTREEVDKQRYALENALASAQVSKHQANQTVVVAPFDGTITRRAIDVGNLATASTPLFSLADVSVLDVELHVPEREAGAVQAGAPATLELQDGTRFAAVVERRAPVVDPLTGTVKFLVRAREYPPGAVPGAFVRAELRVDRRAAAPSLPRTAIFELEGVPHVYVVEDGRARRRPVELGLVGETHAELRGGVEPGATVVADAGEGVTEGLPVKVAATVAGAEDSEADAKDGAAAGTKDGEGEGAAAVSKDSKAVSKDGEAGAKGGKGEGAAAVSKDSKAGPKDSKAGS